MARKHKRDQYNRPARIHDRRRGAGRGEILRQKIRGVKMPQKFILEIDLGNAGMRSPVNIRDALRAIADKIRYDDELDDLTQKIRDINGNVVGKYEVAE